VRALLTFALRQTVLVNLLFLVLMAVGGFTLLSLPVERYPNVHMGKVQISTVLPGASPEEVEALVTREIEDALDDLKSVEFIQSTSYRERSIIVVKFIDDSDYAALYDELRIKVLGVMNELPEGIDPPTFTEINVAEWLPAVSVNLIGDRSNRALSLMAKEMKIALRQIPGVREVQLDGEYTREYHITLSPERLARFGLTFDDVAGALDAANISVPAGKYENASGEFVVVVDEKLHTREDVARVIVRRDGDGSFVTVGDVMAGAYFSYRDPYVISSVNGQDCVTLRIVKADEGNALTIVPAVEALAERYRPALAKDGVDIVLTQDQRLQIDDSITTLGNNLLMGVSLVFVIIFVFMGLRNALLAVVGIPFSFLVTMIFMWLTGNSLNEITLFAFVLVSGIIVDDAIVVTENIYRRLQEGLPLRQAVVDGAAEVAVPVIAATATTVAAFLPMLMMTGSTGEFFAQVPIAVSLALSASLFECLIFLPPHYLDWPGAAGAERKARSDREAEKELWLMSLLRRLTLALLSLVMRLRVTSLVAVTLLFVLAIGVLALSVSGKVPLIRIKFFPDEYVNYFVDLEGPVATAIETTSDKLKAVSSALQAGGPGQARSATAMAGLYLNEDYQAVFGSNLGFITVEMPKKSDQSFPENPENDPQLHLDYVRRLLAPLAADGWQIRVRPEPGGPPAGKAITVRVVGPNNASVAGLAREVDAFLRSDPEVAPWLLDLGDDQGRPSRIYRFRVKSDRAAEFGLTPGEVAMLAGSVLDGRLVGEFRTQDEDIDLRLKIDPEALAVPEKALDLPLLAHPSGPVRLADLTRVETVMEPNKLARYQGNRALTLAANLKTDAPTSSAAIVSRIRDFYRGIKDHYPGAELDFAGEFASTQRSYLSLTYAFCVAILVIYLILATQFHSYLQPLIILSAVVFALIGVVVGKLVSQGLFTINSLIAVVGVTGVVVNDSLVLIDFINRRYREGASRREAIFDGVRLRLRPILLTTLTTVLGLLPMALGFPSYSVVWGSMASTFVTGLATATFLTLFIVPVQWDLLTALTERLAARRARREAKEADKG